MHNLKINKTRYQEFLCQSIRHLEYVNVDALYETYKSLDDCTLFAEAQKNGVASIIAHVFLEKFPKEFKIPNHWVEEFERTQAKITEFMNQLDIVSAHLKKQNIPVVALKNSGIARSIYPFAGANPMGDLDLLIKKEDFYEAHRLISDLGFKFKFRNPNHENNIHSALLDGGSEYCYELNSGQILWLELQWRPISGRWISPNQEPDPQVLIENSVSVGDSSIRILAPEQNLLQVCLHTAKHSFVRAPGFRLHTDVDRIVMVEKIDWKKFIKSVNSLRVRTPVYMSLVLAHNLLRTNIPIWVLNEIYPPKTKVLILSLWLKKVGLFNPNEKKWSNIGYIFFVSLLYDNIGDLWKTILPPISEIKSNNPNYMHHKLPYLYIKRIIGLLFTRTNT